MHTLFIHFVYSCSFLLFLPSFVFVYDLMPFGTLSHRILAVLSDPLFFLCLLPCVFASLLP